VAQRNYPKHTLQQALVVPQKIRDEKAGNPMNRLLVADALGIKPASSNFKYLLSSARQYGLTEGTEKAIDIRLTALGREATQEGALRKAALVRAALAPDVFKRFFEAYDGSKVPSTEMLKKVLAADYEVDPGLASDCAAVLLENGSFVGIIRNISGSPHVMLAGSAEASVAGGVLDPSEPPSDPDEDEPGVENVMSGTNGHMTSAPGDGTPSPAPLRPRAIFIGHGSNTGPLDKLQKILDGFRIPYKVAVAEPHLGRPIPVKVKEVMEQCTSAILIFTKDELFHDKDGHEVWRPSENVVHELGACSYAYDDKIVIFKEAGLNLPSNFSNIGYIEFEEGSIGAKTAELLQELIGFGLITVTPVG
jgi:hypothetical protein